MEKSYYEIMNDISKEELYEKLIKYGLFNDKLPDIFSGESFYDFCINKKHEFECKPYDNIKFESVRNNFIPRVLGIPTPMAHQLLCQCISNNWDEIKNKLKENTENNSYKVSRIHIRKMHNKNELFEMNYNNYKVDGTPEIELLIGKKFLVKTDISTCFPSMYTHALSWALIGKEIAKQTQKDNSKWYNELDRLVRNEKDGETHGFIIGPHTSNILSEIILTVVDKNLTAKGFEYIRNIDDYSCYVEDEARANEFIKELESELGEFDLLLNYKKTQIIPLPITTSVEWIRKLNSFQFNDGKVNFLSVRAYLDLAIELVEKFQDAAILKYAIKVLSKKDLTKSAENYFVKTVFHYSLIYQYLIPLLDITILTKENITTKDKENIINRIYDSGIKLHNYEAVMFAIYYAIKYGVEIKNITVDEILTEKNCIVPLLAYKYFSKNKANIKAIKDYAKKLLQMKDMDRNWIFIYEVLPQSDLSGEWKNMKKNRISFLKT